MLTSLLYLLVRRLLVLLMPTGRDPLSQETEILVLRHRLQVLRRQAKRPSFRRSDRMLRAAMARLLPRDRWGSFFFTPSTLLRWHRELVKRQVDLPFEPTRASYARPLGRRARLAPGETEPAVGVSTDPRRAGQARRPGLGLLGRDHPPTARARAGAEAERTDVVGVPESPGARDPRVRLLHRRDSSAEDALRPVLHRAPDETGALGGGDAASELKRG
jgi:hypothetical protein